MRTHSIEGSERKRDVRFLSLLATAAMFGVPALVLEHVEKLHVDGIVNLLDIVTVRLGPIHFLLFLTIVLHHDRLLPVFVRSPNVHKSQ
jgi:hypothetical protein